MTTKKDTKKKPAITNVENIKAWAEVPMNFIESFGDEGDFSRQYILTPTLLKVLGDITGKRVLDAGSGTGYLSRILAKQGAKVTGVEPADGLFLYAQKRELRISRGVEYIQEDLSRFHQPNTYDFVVANMVLMDIPEYESAMANCIEALKSEGTFIFSIPHPCFECSDLGATKHKSIADKLEAMTEYFEEWVSQERFGYAFHRPLTAYLNVLFANNCLVEQILEPKLDKKTAKKFAEHEREAHIPSFIIVKAVKKE